jgi:filamentous hemagglutinin family protein
MNKIYRMIWSEVNRIWVAVSEITSGRGKQSGTVGQVSTRHVGINPDLHFASMFQLKALAVAIATIGLAHAAPAPNQLPTNGKVVAGSANIAQNGTTLNVNQTTGRAGINWQTFNVGSAATVNFNQPSNSSVTLNRVLDSNPSQIYGHLNANGQVFFTNPNGMYFAPSASVDVGGLVATTHSISDADFMAGNYNFTRNGATGSIVNDGNLTASLGGYIALLAPQVRNNGVIIAQMGTVALAAGENYSLQFDSNNTLADIIVTPATIAALVQNGNAIQAPGGLIILSAQAANSLQGGVVKNSGSLEATGLTSHGGVIRLSASDSISQTGSIKADAAPNSSGNGGTVSIIANIANPNSLTTIDGSISAQGGSLGGNGGAIETSAAHVNIADTAKITTAAANGLTGSWLLDPVDFTIAASGGNITGTALGTALNSNSVTIQTASGGTSCTGAACTAGSTGTNGDINVNDTVSWSGNYTLTLNAYRNININSSITASGTTGALALYYGQGAVKASNTGTYNVNAAVNLMAGNNFSAKLGSDGSVVNYTVITALGSAADATTAPGTMTLQGMAATASLSGNYVLGANIGATATSAWNFVSGTTYAGFTPIGTSTTKFTGTFDGLGHTISNLTINLPSTNYVGLIGWASTSVISNVGLEGGSESGLNYVGGLVGEMAGGTISNSYITGSVSGTGSYIGGLVGINVGTISNSYATGSVSGSNNIGGLAGYSNGTISNSYATGSVRGLSYIGGLVGNNFRTISNSYATGSVSGSSYVGGLEGGSTGTTSKSFYDSTINSTLTGIGSASGNVADAPGTVWGMTTAAMQNQANFTSATGTSATTDHSGNGNVNPNWDFTTPVWRIVSGVNNGYPCLAWSAACVAAPTTQIYLDLVPTSGSTYSSVYGTAPTLIYVYDTSATYSLAGIISNALVAANGTATGGTQSSTGAPTSISNVSGSPYTVTPVITGITGVSSAYTLSAGNAVSWSVTPATLTLRGTQTYNGTSSVAGSSLTATGVLGQTFAVSGSGDTSNLASANVKTNSTLATLTGLSLGSSLGTGTVTSLSTNYSALSTTGSQVSVTKANLTLSGTEVYNGTTTMAGSALTATGVNGETFTVTGTGATDLTVKDVQTNQLLANVTNLTLGIGNTGAAVSGNYNALSTTGSSVSVTKANLEVTANDATKTNDGVAYSGGNGVVYAGFVNSETIAVLGGTLSYAGSSQGAIYAGNYSITPQGLTGGNYQIAYADGSLTMRPAAPPILPVAPPSLPPPAPTPAPVDGVMTLLSAGSGSSASTIAPNGGALSGGVSGSVGGTASANLGQGVTVDASGSANASADGSASIGANGAAASGNVSAGDTTHISASANLGHGITAETTSTDTSEVDAGGSMSVGPNGIKADANVGVSTTNSSNEMVKANLGNGITATAADTEKSNIGAGASATIGPNGVAANANVGASISNSNSDTVNANLGNGVTATGNSTNTQQAKIGAGASLKIGPNGVAESAGVGASVSNTNSDSANLNLGKGVTLVASSTTTEKAQVGASEKLSAGKNGEAVGAQAGATVSVTNTEKVGVHAPGGTQASAAQTTKSEAGANVGGSEAATKQGATVQTGAMVGAETTENTTATAGSHGVKASGTAGVESPGALSGQAGGHATDKNGKVSVGFNVGADLGVGGADLALNVTINTKPLTKDVQKVGTAVKKDAEKVDKEVKKDAKKVDKEVKKDAKKVDKEVKKDAKKVEDGFKKVF